MTTDAPATVAPDPAATVSPGYCSLHPNQRLASHHAVGLRWYGADDPAVCCAMPDQDHPDGSRERCRWCGGPLIPPGVPRWQRSDRIEYCKPSDRLRAFRARAREAAAK